MILRPARRESDEEPGKPRSASGLWQSVARVSHSARTSQRRRRFYSAPALGRRPRRATARPPSFSASASVSSSSRAPFY